MIKEKAHILRFELLMDAGFGAQKAGDILIRSFAKVGKFVYIEPMIPAEISPPPRTRPALSGVTIRVADFDITNIGNDTDFILASHEIVLDRRLDDQETTDKCKILLDMGDKETNADSYEQVLKRVTKDGNIIYPFTIDDEAKAMIAKLNGKGKNMYYIGMLSCIYCMPEEILITEIKEIFGKKLKEEILQQNIKIFQLGYACATDNVEFRYEVISTRKEGEQLLIDGNSAMALGIIDAGFKLLSGYPITPASSIMHTLAKVFPSHGGMVHQAEDEISAIGTAIGSYYSGVPAVTTTSGPGLSLKQEFIGYATVAEIPLVVINCQRSGPSTGMPTKTEQSDLPAMLYGCHGDNTKVIISVCNVRDCFRAPALARYLAEKLRMPIFIVSDFQTSTSYKVIDEILLNNIKNIEDVPSYVFERFHIKPLPDKIEMVRTVQSDPGTPNDMRRVTGLNTDATGTVNYFAWANQRSHKIRNEKVHAVRRALTVPEIIGPEEGDILVIGWGSTRGAIEEAIQNCRKDGLSVSAMQFRIVYPLPLMLKEVFAKFKKVLTVELTYADPLKHPPLMMLLRDETLVDIDAITCRATGRPLQPLMIEKELREQLSQLN